MNINSSNRWPWIMLFSRIILFLGIQALLALGFFITGKNGAWENAAGWWPFIVTTANVICIFLLVYLFSKEGKSYWSIFRLEKSKIGSDLLAMLGALIITGPVSYLPNIMLGKALFGDPLIPLDMMLRPLPYAVVFISIIAFPITQGLVEIPTYFSYVMPRFEKQGFPGWLALGIPSLFLGFQHIAVPFLFNLNFITWRALMFIPFAFLVGILMKWRPRLMPYMAVVHIVMDAAFVVMLLNKAY